MYYYELPVYKKALELEVCLIRSTNKVNTDFRVGLIVPIKAKIQVIAKKIAFADVKKDERVKFIDEALETLKDVEIDIRCLYDMRVLPKKGWSAIIKAEGELAKQLSSWKKATINDLPGNQQRE